MSKLQTTMTNNMYLNRNCSNALDFYSSQAYQCSLTYQPIEHKLSIEHQSLLPLSSLFTNQKSK